MDLRFGDLIVHVLEFVGVDLFDIRHCLLAKVVNGVSDASEAVAESVERDAGLCCGHHFFTS